MIMIRPKMVDVGLQVLIFIINWAEIGGKDTQTSAPQSKAPKQAEIVLHHWANWISFGIMTVTSVKLIVKSLEMFEQCFLMSLPEPRIALAARRSGPYLVSLSSDKLLLSLEKIMTRLSISGSIIVQEILGSSVSWIRSASRCSYRRRSCRSSSPVLF